MKKMKKLISAILSLAMAASLVTVPAKAATEKVELLQNGGFETADSYGFPSNWDSEGKNLFLNSDFENRKYWNYNNGYLSYEYDEERKSTVARLEWNALNKWNGVTSRIDRLGIYWDYEKNKQIKDTEYFPGIPVAWGEQYIPRMNVKYAGNISLNHPLEMEVTVGTATSDTINGRAFDVINVKASTLEENKWHELGGEGYTFTIPAAANVNAAFTDTMPAELQLVNVGRSQTPATGDYTTAFTWTDDISFEKLSRTSDAEALSGSKSLMIKGYADGLAEKWVSDYVDISEGETIDVGTNVKVSDIADYTRDNTTYSKKVAVSVEFDNGTVIEAGSFNNVTDGFSAVKKSVTVPDGATAARLVYTFDGKGVAYFDDAEIKAEREVADIDLGAYSNKLSNSGFETVDKYDFPTDWESDGKNLVANGDFETGDLSAGKNLAGTKAVSYKATGYASGVEIAENINAPAELGKYSIKINWKDTKWGAAVVQDDNDGVMPIAYNSEYIARADVKAGKNTDFPAATEKFQFAFVTNYQKIGMNNKDFIVDNNSWVPTTEWQNFTKKFTTIKAEEAIDPIAPRINRYLVRTRQAALADAVLYVDNYRVEKMSRTDSSEKNSGNKSLKIVAYDDGVDEVWTSKRVAVRENTDIAIGAAYKTASLSGGVNIAVNFYSGDEKIGKAALCEGAESASWKNTAKLVAVPAGADGAELEITVSGKSGTAWIDDVFLGEEVSDPYINSVEYSVNDLYGHDGETVNVSINVANYNEKSSVFAASALFDGADNLVYVSASETEIPGNQTAYTVTRQVKLPENTDLTDYRIETMLWRSADSLVPLCEVSVFPKEELEFTVNKVFQSGMVLQRDEEISIYGQGTPGEPITVALAEDSETVAVNSLGEWRVKLPARVASTAPVTMKVSGRGGREFYYDNILIGDVFIMSGQSNAAFSISEVPDFIASPDEANDNIRCLGIFDIGNADAKGSEVEEKELPGEAQLNPTGKTGVTDPTWLSFDPKSTKGDIQKDPLTRDTSAILYYFAKDVQAKLKEETGATIPVGIITSAVGGSRIERWIPSEVYAENPDLTADNAQQKSTLYNLMINPLTKLSVKGILWYQGCANAASSVRYEREMTLLIESWRDRFGDENMPFIIHQLAGYGDQYALLRDSQKRVAKAMDNVDITVLIDLGEELDVHPKAKIQAAKRTANTALKNWYNIANDCEYADLAGYEAVVRDGINAMKLSFTNAQNGFYTVNAEGERDENALPGGFLVADESGDFKVAEAVINADNTITVWNKAVTNPVYVRYAFEGFPYPAFANLHTANGLPLMPFRNDTINVECRRERAQMGENVNLLMDGDFEKIAANGTTFTDYFQHRITNTSYGGTAVGVWDNPGDKYGNYYLDMTLKNGTGNANTQVYAALTGAKGNVRIPVRAGKYIIEADVETTFTDSSTSLYFQWNYFDNNEKQLGSYYTNKGEWIVKESTDGMIHLVGEFTVDDAHDGCYLYAFGTRLVTKSAEVQSAKIDNVVIRRAD